MQKHNLTLSVNIEGMNLTPYLFYHTRYNRPRLERR